MTISTVVQQLEHLDDRLADIVDHLDQLDHLDHSAGIVGYLDQLDHLAQLQDIAESLTSLIDLLAAPSRQEALNLTLIVVAFTVFMAALLGIIDYIFAWLFGLVIR